MCKTSFYYICNFALHFTLELVSAFCAVVIVIACTFGYLQTDDELLKSVSSITEMFGEQIGL